MNIFDLAFEYKKPPSKRILVKIFDLPNEEVDKDALEIILYATEEGVQCKETAKNIAIIIEESDRIKEDMFRIIRGLAIGDYFHSTPEISDKIKTYLESIDIQFDSFEEIEFHDDLPENPTITFLEKNQDGPVADSQETKEPIILLTLMTETNSSGYRFFFARRNCFKYVKFVGDFPPQIIGKKNRNKSKGAFWDD